jgi:SAM-dependent methyltransferase
LQKQTLGNSLEKFWNRRFAFLRWPLDLFRERVDATREAGFFSHRAKSTRYPIRGVRYWWVLCALRDEVRKQKRRLRIADVGCSKGFMKDFTGDALGAEWVGLDLRIDHQALEKSGYHEAYTCDFDRSLPLPDGSVDVAVFLHVIEHLPRPSFTMRELSRILRPGGLLLAGSPIAPGPIAWIREKQLRSRLSKGKILPGAHINSMACGRWRTLVKETGLDLRILTGTFLARWSGSPLENQAWWLRLNQLWGALFPSLGGEAYLSARKPAAADFTAEHPAAGHVFMPWSWKRGLALSFIVIIILSWSFFFNDRGPSQDSASPQKASQKVE